MEEGRPSHWASSLGSHLSSGASEPPHMGWGAGVLLWSCLETPTEVASLPALPPALQPGTPGTRLPGSPRDSIHQDSGPRWPLGSNPLRPRVTRSPADPPRVQQTQKAPRATACWDTPATGVQDTRGHGRAPRATAGTAKAQGHSRHAAHTPGAHAAPGQRPRTGQRTPRLVARCPGDAAPSPVAWAQGALVSLARAWRLQQPRARCAHVGAEAGSVCPPGTLAAQRLLPRPAGPQGAAPSTFLRLLGTRLPCSEGGQGPGAAA